MRKRHQDENEPAVGPIPAALRHPKSGPWTTPSDVVIALSLFLLSLFGRSETGGETIQGASSALFLLMAGACALAMAVRRHSPMIFVLVAGVCLSAHLVLLPEPTLFFTMVAFVAVETTQSRLEAPWRWVGLALELAGAAMTTVRLHGLWGDSALGVWGGLWDPTTAGVLVGGAVFSGAARRRRRDRYNQAFERATVLETQQATERRLAVVETQQRIARDVHDLLGHTLTVIAMQAEGARAILASNPAAADEALAVIGETSRRSVDEVRALVDILRADAEDNAVADTAGAEVGAESSTEEAASSQQVESLRALVRQAQHAGLPVILETDLDGEFPAAAARVLYRVMQESLTNVLRHAPGRDATVSLRTGNGRALLVIENAPNPEASSAQMALVADAADTDRKDSSRRRGFGLLGMRDRVTDLDGSFSAGPTTEGGWRVTAELPIAG